MTRPRIVTLAVALLLGATPPGFGDTKTEPRQRGVYEPLAWLIGTWEGVFVPPGATGRPTMTFEWSPYSTHIRYSAQRPQKGGLAPEYEGVIVWHPVQRRFLFLQPYPIAGPTLTEEGWVELLDDGSARFHMNVHYAPGVGLPWSDGAKAGDRGETLRFRRTLAPEGQSAMFGEFLMWRDDAWVVPEFPFEVPARGFEWHRVAGD